ncbi:aldo/keto reductase [Dactylosporangium sp. NPDC051541]|uniref:aldo/keto reductase n=1 Tax=Dactylosporangium sp. NPDC051541 TaxID=3363977 RepID=UPI00379565FC
MNRVGLGAMRLALGRAVPPKDVALRLLRRAVELGVVHIDSHALYGNAHELIREALAPYPDDLVIATKVTREAPGSLREQVLGDLRRLGQDRLDLVYLRTRGMGPAGGEPVAEQYAQLLELRAEGLVRDAGLSHVDGAQLAEARAAGPVAAVQNRFHLGHDDPVLADCERDGIAYVPYFPLGGGRPLDRPALATVAARHGVTPTQAALAWLLAASPVIVAIPGTAALTHLEQNMAAGRLELDPEDRAALQVPVSGG